MKDVSTSASKQKKMKRKRNETAITKSITRLDELDTNALKKLQGEELERFESYRRSAIPRAAMKKVG